MRKPLLFISLFLLLLPRTSLAKGHADCQLCHKNAQAGDYSLTVTPDETLLNPYTKTRFGRLDAICLSCHQKDLKLENMHPVGIVPRQADVPAEALQSPGQENQLTCMSCHNFHPDDKHDNSNYKYLRWAASPDKGGLTNFCTVCHPKQGSRRS